MADVPHFSVTTVTGEKVEYSSIWQRRNLVLIALPTPRAPDATAYAAQLRHALFPKDTTVVITSDEIRGLKGPAVMIADRWGEVVHSVRTEHAADLPDAQELLDWVEHVRQRCPECEGEAR